MMTLKPLQAGLFLTLVVAAAGAAAQVPVDEDGRLLDTVEPHAGADTSESLLSGRQLVELVSPIALYPDDLLAIVLPAATYPLQIVEAGRFLDALADDPSLEPDADWDDTVVALVNYPEVVELLNEDLDWTWQLGEAVITRQADVIGAVETFRDRAYAAGNLKSDDHQSVIRDDGVIEIEPVEDDIIYVPFYEPEAVVEYQSTPVYHYYAEPRPVYYYPYPAGHAFRHGYFWGVTTAFTIGWASDRVRVYHSTYDGHPYFGHYYPNRWWYRRPPISIHRSIYIDNRVHYKGGRRARGDYWRPSRNVRLRHSDQRISRGGYFKDRGVRSKRSTRHRSTFTDNRIRKDQTTRRPVRSPDRAVSRGRREQMRASRAQNKTAARRDRQPELLREQRRATGPGRLTNDGARRRENHPPAIQRPQRHAEAPARVARADRRDSKRRAKPERAQRQKVRPSAKASRAERTPRVDRRDQRRDRSIRRQAKRHPK